MRIAIDGLNIRKGGGENVMLRLAQALVRHGHQPVIFSGSRETEDRARAHAGMLDVEFVHVRAAQSAVGAIVWRRRQFSSAAAARKCTKVIGFNYWTPTGIPQATLHINVIPFLSLQERRRAVGLPRALLQRHYAFAALRRSHLNLFESKHLRVLAEASFHAPIRNPHTTYVGVDLPARAAMDPVKPPYLVAVTSPAAHKNNHYLADLHMELHRRRPDLAFAIRIVGVGREIMDGNREFSSRKGYVDSRSDIQFDGYVDRDRLQDILAGAFALISFSELESFFMVAVEAMACGCPPVCADISSVRESVGHAGLLFPPGNIQEAASAVLRLEDGETRARLISDGFKFAHSFATERCFDNIVAKLEDF